MIHKIYNEKKRTYEYVISSYQVWRPGCYDTRKTANYAFRFTDEVLSELQESVNPGGTITYEMLKNAKNKNLKVKKEISLNQKKFKERF
jgi:hypothetical protein